MDFKNIREVFAEHNLRPPTLNVLVPDAHFYETLAVQPRGEIALRPDFIGHADPQTAVSQFSDFLRLAIERESDVVLSPEYSCPWEVLTNAITQQSLPQAGKIWMLGCEAITPNDLRAVILAHANVVWIHEPIPAGTGRFLDVLVYATKTETTSRTTPTITEVGCGIVCFVGIQVHQFPTKECVEEPSRNRFQNTIGICQTGARTSLHHCGQVI